LIGVMAISRDITERKRLEAQLRDQYEKLKELDKLKGDFVNAVSHDLRTPLTSILGFAEFLEDEIGGLLSPQQRGFVEQIENSTKRLEGMVNDLLDFARLDAGTFRLHCVESDLVGRVRDLVESLRPQAEERRLELRTELPRGPLMHVLDPQRIDRVLANLIGNALKFTPEGGRIVVKLVEEPEGLVCEVSDTGSGIAPEDLPKLFQRFTQLEAGARMKAGTGLGLSISKAQVEAHGGTIGVRSMPGEGSTFWFRLPREVPAPCRADARAS
jgi:signal transduction histidine kinase